MSEGGPKRLLAHPRVKAFVDAGRGVLSGLQTQPHLRFHVFAAMLVMVLIHLAQAKGMKISIGAGVAILLLFGVVMGLELVNSAVESACDAVTRDHNPLIGRAKDMAAGAVLVMAVAAAVSGLMLLGPMAAEVFFCEPYLLEQPTFAPAAALVAAWLLHHFLAKSRAGWLFAVAALWSGGVLAFASSWWVGLLLPLLIVLGVYGDRMRHGAAA